MRVSLKVKQGDACTGSMGPLACATLYTIRYTMRYVAKRTENSKNQNIQTGCKFASLPRQGQRFGSALCANSSTARKSLRQLSSPNEQTTDGTEKEGPGSTAHVHGHGKCLDCHSQCRSRSVACGLERNVELQHDCKTRGGPWEECCSSMACR